MSSTTPISKGQMNWSAFQDHSMSLSMGGVDFCLVPSDESMSLNFVQNSPQEVVFDLNSFSGRLVVSPTNKAMQHEPGAYSFKITPNVRDGAQQGSSSASALACKKRNAPSCDNTPQTTIMTAVQPSPLLQRLLQDEDDDEDTGFPDCYQNSQSTSPAKKLKPSPDVQQDQDDKVDEAPPSQSQTQETLLAQMELSQTQPSVLSQTQPSNDDDDHVMSESSSAAPTLQRTSSIDRTSHLKNILNAAESRPTSPVVASLHSHGHPKSKPETTEAETSLATLQETAEQKSSNTEKQEADRMEKESKEEPVMQQQVAATTEQSKAKDAPRKNTNTAKPKKKTQKKAKTTTDVSSDDSSTASSKKSKVTPRVSIGSPEKDLAPPATQPPPSARWGHTVTPVNNGRLVVYGGQAIHPETKLPQTLNDLYLYDTNKETWFKPFSGDGLPRQWHTSTYLADRQLLIAFGGESMNPKSGKVRTHSNVTVLDTELMVWYPPTVSGEVPSGRSGHSAAMVDQDLVVFGGVKGAKWLNTVSVLNTQNWVWRQPKIQGSAPKPRSYHSATTVGSNRVVVFGGNDADESFATVHVLEKMQDGDTWQWTHPMVTGYPPKPRTGHSATLLPDGKNICIYGGWDPNDDDAKDDAGLIWNDAFLLNTETWQWKQLPKSFSKRVGHETMLMPHAADETSIRILAFGGRIPRDQFTNEMEIVEINETQ